MATFAEVDFKSWAIHPPPPSLRGARLFPVCDQNATTPCFKLVDAPVLTTPFGATSYDEGSTRLTLDFYIEDEHVAFFKGLDKHFIAFIAANSERLLKKSYTIAQVTELYRPFVTVREGWPPSIRTKVNTIGARRVRVWTADLKCLEELPAAQELREAKLCPVLAVKGMWCLGGRELGITLETTHLQIGQSEPRACPFTSSTFTTGKKESDGA